MQIGATSFARSCFDQRVKNIDFVVAVHVLQNGGQTLKAHARVNARCGQIVQAAIGLHVKLHEHVVPDFNVTIAILLGATGRAARHFWTMVVENFGARTARAGVGHHPEIVGHVASAFVVTNAHHALGWQANLFGPDVVGFVVFNIDRCPEFFGGQFVNLCEQFKSPFQTIAFEIVAKTPIAQHFKKGVVARGVTHVFQIVVLAASAQTSLNRGCAHITALIGAQEHVLELNHARVGEHQSGIVARHQGTGSHHGVTFGRKKVEEGFANISNRNNRCAHGRGIFVKAKLGLTFHYKIARSAK